MGSVLIHPSTANEKPTSTDLGRWAAIFSYLHFNEYERLSVRSLCRLFRAVLPGPTCAGVYTVYPHPNHASLRSLMNRLNGMASVWGSNVPERLFLANGVHKIEDEDFGGFTGEVNVVKINIPISIIGESREHCIVMGGLAVVNEKKKLPEGWRRITNSYPGYIDRGPGTKRFRSFKEVERFLGYTLPSGKKEVDVNVSDLTLRDSKDCGISAEDGASIHLDNVNVENSGKDGVVVSGTKRNSMKNCNVSHSKGSGLVVAGGGLMTIDGNGTTIHHNCTKGDSDDNGLHTFGSSSSIHLASIGGYTYQNQNKIQEQNKLM